MEIMLNVLNRMENSKDKSILIKYEYEINEVEQIIKLSTLLIISRYLLLKYIVISVILDNGEVSPKNNY